MKTIKVVIETGYLGCEIWDTFEVEDDATVEEIDRIALDVKDDLTSDWTWYIEDEDEDEE